jgi:hypothetical protein
MIKKVANNETNQEPMNLEPTEKIIEKLDYYRSLIPKLHELSDAEMSDLKKDVGTFFNIKPIVFSKQVPEYLVRISSNTNILGENLNFITNIDHLLSPPSHLSKFNRCNLPGEEVIYCATDETTAYWETKPKKGDVISISLFKAKENATLNCAVIDPKRKAPKKLNNELEEVFYLINDFFVEVFTMPVERDNPKKYFFSSTIASEQLFYPIEYEHNIEAMVYPSVQRKMNGHNFALKNDIILEKYDLVEVTTRFIIDEYENIDPASSDRPIDDLIASISIKEFDFDKRELIYPKDFYDRFDFFRHLQMMDGKQVRFEKPMGQKEFNEYLKTQSILKKSDSSKKLVEKKYGRNDKVTVMYYNNGPVKKDIKYKFVEKDIKAHKCMIIKEN